MADTCTTLVKLEVRAVLAPEAPHAGSIEHAIDASAHRGHGTGANQADQCYMATLSVDSTGTNVNLRSLTDALGNSLVPAEVVDFAFQASTANTADVNITATETSGGAADPWLGWLIASGDGVQLPPGCRLAVMGGPDGAFPLSASSRGLKFAAASGTQSVTLIFTFRSQ